MPNKMGKRAPKGYFTCRVCKEFSPYKEDRNLFLCPSCKAIEKPCDCGCGEAIPKYLSDGSIHHYKDKVHWNNHQWSDPTIRAAKVKEIRQRWEDPEYAEQHRQRALRFSKDPKIRKKRSEFAKRQWQNPEYRRYMAECHQRWRQTPEGKKHAKEFGNRPTTAERSKKAKRQWETPEIRAKMETSIRQAYQKPEVKKGHREACQAGWTDKVRLKVSGPGNHNWTGGPEVWYGENWNIQSEKAKQRDPVCQHCGKTDQDNGAALCTHHIIPFKFFGLENYELANDLDNLICYCTSCHMRCPIHQTSHQDIDAIIRNGDPIPGPEGTPIPNDRTTGIRLKVLRERLDPTE